MGKFTKGHKKVGGRTKGTSNKDVQPIREAFQKLIEDNLENMTLWLERIAEENPSKALDIISNLSEYIIPKLARTETLMDLNANISTETADFLKELNDKLE